MFAFEKLSKKTGIEQFSGLGRRKGVLAPALFPTRPLERQQ